MERDRTEDVFAHLFGHLRDQLLIAFVASFGPTAGRATTLDVLSHARHHWITMRHRDDLVPHLFRIGHRLGDADGQPFADDPVSRALAGLSVDERLSAVLVLGLEWPLDAASEVTGVSIAALHRHHDHAAAGVGASLRSAGIRNAGAALHEWAEATMAMVPEITLGEVDAHHPPPLVPISGWRRFSRAVGSVAAGVLLVIGLGLIAWQLVRWGDDAVARWTGPDPPTTLAGPSDTVAATTVPPGTVTYEWIDHAADPGIPPGTAVDLAVGPDGSVWVALHDEGRLHVAVRDSMGWSVRDAGLEEVERPVRWMAVSGEGIAWLAIAAADGGEQLYGFDGTGWVALDGLRLWGSIVHEGSGGELWAAGLDERMRPTRLEWAGDRWAIARADATPTVDGHDTIDGLERDELRMRIAIGDDGIAWFAGDAVTVRFDGRREISVGSQGDPWVVVAHDGSVWTPTEHGVRRFDDEGWAYFDARHGLPGTSPVAGTIRFTPGHTWIEFDGGEGLLGFLFDGSGWTEATTAPAGAGLVFWPSGAPRYAFTPRSLVTNGTEDGVWYRAQRGWVPVLLDGGDELRSVEQVLADPAGTLWIIAEGRLSSVRIDET